MLRRAVEFAVMTLICYAISECRIWLDLDRVLYSKAPGDCRTMLKGGGSEDFAELDEDIILVSSMNNQALEGNPFGLPGKIYALHTNGTLEEANVVNKVNKDNPLLAPHGLSIWKDLNNGQTLLYVIVHGLTDEGVGVFEVTKYPLTLTYIKTITDSTFSGIMNGLVVVGRDTFFITQSVWWRSIVGFALEFTFQLPTGKLVYYDGTSGRVVLSGLRVANGIAISIDKRTLYVAESGKKKIHALKIQNGGDVETDWVEDIGTCPDNIQVDQSNGDLWIGCIPHMGKAIDMLGILGPHQHAAQVLRVRLADNKVADVEEVYVNNGSVVTGSSVALYKNNKLFIGTIAAQLVMCDVNYLPN